MLPYCLSSDICLRKHLSEAFRDLNSFTGPGENIGIVPNPPVQKVLSSFPILILPQGRKSTSVARAAQTPYPGQITDAIPIEFLAKKLLQGQQELTGVAGKAWRCAVLLGEVLAAAADGLGAVQGHKLVGLARTTLHSARHRDGALFGKHLIVCFVLFIPKTGKAVTFSTLLVFSILPENLTVYFTSFILK